MIGKNNWDVEVESVVVAADGGSGGRVRRGGWGRLARHALMQDTGHIR